MFSSFFLSLILSTVAKADLVATEIAPSSVSQIRTRAVYKNILNLCMAQSYREHLKTLTSYQEGTLAYHILDLPYPGVFGKYFESIWKNQGRGPRVSKLLASVEYQTALRDCFPTNSVKHRLGRTYMNLIFLQADMNSKLLGVIAAAGITYVTIKALPAAGSILLSSTPLLLRYPQLTMWSSRIVQVYRKPAVRWTTNTLGFFLTAMGVYSTGRADGYKQGNAEGFEHGYKAGLENSATSTEDSEQLTLKHFESVDESTRQVVAYIDQEIIVESQRLKVLADENKTHTQEFNILKQHIDLMTTERAKLLPYLVGSSPR